MMYYWVNSQWSYMATKFETVSWNVPDSKDFSIAWFTAHEAMTVMMKYSTRLRTRRTETADCTWLAMDIWSLEKPKKEDEKWERMTYLPCLELRREMDIKAQTYIYPSKNLFFSHKNQRTVHLQFKVSLYFHNQNEVSSVQRNNQSSFPTVWLVREERTRFHQN